VLEVQKLAAATGNPRSQVAINWVCQQPKAQMIPILGVLTLKLSDEQWQRLDEVSAIDLGFPHGFLDRIHTSTAPRSTRSTITGCEALVLRP
jgi:diketogulonate reductase-like aldo/keto reductase